MHSHLHSTVPVFLSNDYYLGKQYVDMNWTFKCKWDNNIYVLIEQFDYVFDNSKIMNDKLEVGDWHDWHTGVNKWTISGSP